jgi:tetratricopeptide (TPR) repeat protein
MMRIGLLWCIAILGLVSGGQGAHTQVDGRFEVVLDSARTAAEEDRHRDAARHYQDALELAPHLRPRILAPLGRHLLWSGDATAAVGPLSAYLTEVDPADLGVRLHLADALTWSDRLGAALVEYRRTLGAIERYGAHGYPEAADLLHASRHGEARALRWQRRYEEAEAAYRAIVEDDPADHGAVAGVALTLQDSGRPRAALEHLESATAEALPSELATVRARIRADVGRPEMALQELRAHTAASPEPDGEDVAETLQALRRQLRPGLALSEGALRDNDGLAQRQTRVSVTLPGAGRPVGLEATAEAGIERTSLAGLKGVPEAPLWRVDAGATVTPSDGLRLTARGEVIHGYGGSAGPPLLAGEGGVAWFPGDRRRVDVSVARIPVLDHPGAIEDGFFGDLISVGTDQPLGRRVTVAVGADRTRWRSREAVTLPGEVDAVRTRLRAVVTLPLEGVPAITLTWPTLVQRYSAPIPLGFYSPRLYLETGPSVDLYRRLPGPWHLWADLRIGGQVEWDPYHEGADAVDGGVLRPLGRVRGSIEREFSAWTVGIHGSWTNSNLTGDRGFERGLVRLEIRHRL